MQNKRVLFIGHIAPPFGGVAVHIARLAAHMKRMCSVDFIDESSHIKKEYFNFRSLKLFTYLRKIRNADIVHIHSSDWRLRFFHIAIARLLRKHCVVTLHSFRTESGLLVAAHRRILKLAHARVFVSRDIQEKLLFVDDHSYVKEGFIPPLLKDEAPLPHYLINEIEQAQARDAKILISNASRLDEYNGEDLYGVDLAINLMEHLSNRRDVICIFIVSSLEKHADKFHFYQQQYIEKGLEASFLLLYENLSFPLLMQHADIVLRLTNTDGDSLTVREALELGVVPIASDVVQRPSGTVLYKNRDLQDLINKVEHVLDSPPNLEKTTHHPMDFYHTLYKIDKTDNKE